MKHILSPSFLKYQLPLYLYIVGIFALSSIPGNAIPDIDSELAFDKVIHFVEYGILGFLLFRGIFSSERMSARRSFLLVILCAAAVGALDEFYQRFTGRNSDVYDWVSDSLGATTVSICCLALYAKIQKIMATRKPRNFHL